MAALLPGHRMLASELVQAFATGLGAGRAAEGEKSTLNTLQVAKLAADAVIIRARTPLLCQLQGAASAFVRITQEREYRGRSKRKPVVST